MTFTAKHSKLLLNSFKLVVHMKKMNEVDLMLNKDSVDGLAT